MARLVSFRMLLRPIVRGTVVGAAVLSMNFWIIAKNGPEFRWFSSVFISYVVIAIESFLVALVFSMIVASIVLLVAYIQLRRHNPINPRSWQRGVIFSAGLLGAVPALMLVFSSYYMRLKFGTALSDFVFFGIGPLIGSVVGGLVFVRAVQRQIDARLIR